MDATSVTQFYLVWSHNENIYDFRCDQLKYNFLTMPIIWFLISTMCFSNRSFQIDIVSTFIYLVAATLEKKWPWQKMITTITKYIYIITICHCFHDLIIVLMLFLWCLHWYMTTVTRMCNLLEVKMVQWLLCYGLIGWVLFFCSKLPLYLALIFNENFKT